MHYYKITLLGEHILLSQNEYKTVFGEPLLYFGEEEEEEEKYARKDIIGFYATRVVEAESLSLAEKEAEKVLRLEWRSHPILARQERFLITSVEWTVQLSEFQSILFNIYKKYPFLLRKSWFGLSATEGHTFFSR